MEFLETSWVRQLWKIWAGELCAEINFIHRHKPCTDCVLLGVQKQNLLGWMNFDDDVFLSASEVAGLQPVSPRWGHDKYLLRVTGKDKQVFIFTSVCEVPSSTAWCLAELFLTGLKMPLVYNCLISSKCAQLRWQQDKRLAKCGVSVLGAFCFQHSNFF